ncbi:hypothetical protein [Teichococcus wenyumeiae]|uniref:hypothetical protein n=1 Tax=Teichococcus wenyumeiae TaxID=2478470 RepID=UPI0011C3547A|nr:hypothetical protein [Pseudoroseomonas wenyumeiae]
MIDLQAGTDKEILAALIQAVGTIIAAVFAIVAALITVRNWKHEAPGRRRMELTEAAWGAVYDALRAIRDLRMQVVSFGLGYAAKTRFSSEVSMERSEAAHEHINRIRNLSQEAMRSVVDLEFECRKLRIFGVNAQKISNHVEHEHMKVFVAAKNLIRDYERNILTEEVKKQATDLNDLDDLGSSPEAIAERMCEEILRPVMRGKMPVKTRTGFMPIRVWLGRE